MTALVLAAVIVMLLLIAVAVLTPDPGARDDHRPSADGGVGPKVA